MDNTTSPPQESVYRDYNLGERFVSSIIYGVVLGALRRVSANDLKDIILQKRELDLFVRNLNRSSALSTKFIEMGREHRDKIEEWVVVDKLLVRLEVKRPDLYRVVNTTRGNVWFSENVRRFRELLISAIDK